MPEALGFWAVPVSYLFQFYITVLSGLQCPLQWIQIHFLHPDCKAHRLRVCPALPSGLSREKLFSELSLCDGKISANIDKNWMSATFQVLVKRAFLRCWSRLTRGTLAAQFASFLTNNLGGHAFLKSLIKTRKLRIPIKWYYPSPFILVAFGLISSCPAFIPDFIVKRQKRDFLEKRQDKKETPSGVSAPVKSLPNCFLRYISKPPFAYSYVWNVCGYFFRKTERLVKGWAMGYLSEHLISWPWWSNRASWPIHISFQ